MDALVQEGKYSGSMDGFKFDHKSNSAFSEQNLANGSKLGHPVSDPHEFGILPNDPNPSNLVPSSDTGLEMDYAEGHDFIDSVLKYIGDMLMEEEDLARRPCMFQDSLSLQATEKSFYDALGEEYPSPLDIQQHPLFVLNQNENNPNANFTRTFSCHGSNSSTTVNNYIDSNRFHDEDKIFESSFLQPSQLDYNFNSISQSIGSSNSFSDGVDGPVDSLCTPFHVLNSFSESQLVSQYEIRNDVEPNEKNRKAGGQAEKNGRNHSPNESKGKKNHYREDSDYVEGGPSNKQLASYSEETDEQSKMYDVLLCPGVMESMLCADGDASCNGQSKGSNGRRPRGKRQGNKKEVVDLMNLLTQCAHAMASNDGRSANELLKRIRQHSSPFGDGTERLAHYFANALDARLAGAGTGLSAFASTGMSAADFLKCYLVYIKACPFTQLSNLFANRSIRKLTNNATTLHIIDFGILYGFQWPCLLQTFSLRPGGPPKIRMTGIDFPQPGFKPAERVEETGNRLAKLCKRFDVPFEYTAIAKKWDSIQLEDLKIETDEVLVVNCLFRLKNVPDDTVVVSSPRDDVLKLIERINPDLFVHGVANGTFNTPFFVTRFREALFHFSSLYDIFEATVPREDQDRMMFEREVFGRDVMNVIACEGTQRVERPETYKQWQARNVRAGFRQLPLDQEIVKDVRTRVRKGYDKDFMVDEDSNWMLQGWKGRIIYAVSCWKPAKKF